MNVLSIDEFSQNEYLFNEISSELLNYIKINNNYIEKIYINNFVNIYVFNKDNYETVFFIIYKTGCFYSDYYYLTAVTSNNIITKSIIITHIEHQERELTFPFNHYFEEGDNE
jgi:hypothetical protein